jgi:hypothetical protein
MFIFMLSMIIFKQNTMKPNQLQYDLALAVIVMLVTIPSIASGKPQQRSKPTEVQKSVAKKFSSSSPNLQPPKYLKAFVIDDRLSVLRREPRLQSEALHRLRLGRQVFIVGASGPRSDQPKFYRIAVTRRTRGWIHASGLAVPGHAGDDQRILYEIEHNAEGLERILLCKLLAQLFAHSRLVPRSMYLFGQEADRLAQTLSQRAQRRLASVSMSGTNLRDYYLSDVGLDRFSKLGVIFNYDDSRGEYVYDGKVYRELIKRFPHTDEAKLARQRLESN